VTKLDLKKSFALALVVHLTMGFGATFLSTRINVLHTPQMMEVMVLPPEPGESAPAAPEIHPAAPMTPKIRESQPPPKLEVPPPIAKAIVPVQSAPQPIQLAEIHRVSAAKKKPRRSGGAA
jgi:hypothetical protein